MFCNYYSKTIFCHCDDIGRQQYNDDMDTFLHTLLHILTMFNVIMKKIMI